MTRRCKSCYYYGNTTNTCDFFLVTGVRRGCPVEDCNRHEPLSNRNKKFCLHPNPRAADRCRKMKQFYLQGMNDPQIAAQVGVAQQTVFMWRKKNGLPAHARFGGDRKI